MHFGIPLLTLRKPLHCHVAWHLSAGFIWNVLEHPEELQNGDLEIPDEISTQCDNWKAWNKDHHVRTIIVSLPYYDYANLSSSSTVSIRLKFS